MAKARESGESGESRARTDPHEERARSNLEKWIKLSGYSITEVADFAGIPQANLLRYVNGKSALAMDAIPKLIRALGRESTDEFHEADPPKQRHRSEIEIEQPIVAKARPGVTLTPEELDEINETLDRISARRVRQSKRK